MRRLIPSLLMAASLAAAFAQPVRAQEVAPATSPVEAAPVAAEATATPAAEVPSAAPVAAPAQPVVYMTPRMARMAQYGAQGDYNRLRFLRGEAITRAGKYTALAGAAALVAGIVAFAATTDRCYDDYYYDEDLGDYYSSGCYGDGASAGSAALLTLGWMTLLAGDVTWATGTLISANAIHRAGNYAHPQGAAIAALVGAVVFAPVTWVAAPIQSRINRWGGAQTFGTASRPAPQLALTPMLGHGRGGLTLGLTF